MIIQQPTQEEQDPTSQSYIDKEVKTQQLSKQPILCPYRLVNGHWLTISRPQYKRTCGLSSLVSIWNYQFSKLGLGDKDPISIEQAMLKLNLIGNGSAQQNFRNKFKKKQELTQRPQNIDEDDNEQIEDPQIVNSKKTLHQYIDLIDFGVFTGNEALMKWYRILCRIYGGSGRSSMFYKTNSSTSLHKNQESAKKGLIEGLNSNGRYCFIYHAYDHYFCPVGYQFMPKSETNGQGVFNSSSLSEQGQLYVMVGQSSKMFPCMHVFNWKQINLDLETYWPKYYNIRRRQEGVQIYEGKEDAQARKDTINCIMVFEKIKD